MAILSILADAILGPIHPGVVRSRAARLGAPGGSGCWHLLVVDPRRYAFGSPELLSWQRLDPPDERSR